MAKEPSLEEIDDYNDHESKKKRKTINIVVILLIVLSIVYSIIQYENDTVSDYIGTPAKPGINTTKG